MCLWDAVARENKALREELRETRVLLENARKRTDAWRVADRAGDAVAARYECKVCMARPIEVAFLPCGHSLCCAPCARRTRLRGFPRGSFAAWRPRRPSCSSSW